MIDLQKLSLKAFNTAKQRGQVAGEFKHLAGEVIEAQEAFTKLLYNKEDKNIGFFETELADVLICTLSICGHYGIDITSAVNKKMKINDDRAKNGR